MSESVKVAVRVRPFNDREKKMGYAKRRCVFMEGPTTIMKDNTTGKEKRFTFDYSYYSTDSSAPNFATNETVYNDLGKSVLDNAWKGFNCCLFAYGQTGAGKSYSMVGYPNKDPGIVPRAMDEIFKRIAANTDKNVSYEVKASMLEIYNEAIRDLFNPSNPLNKKKGLPLRVIPKVGPRVTGIREEIVTSYEQIQGLMDKGTQSRTVAATQMNATSSRAHTVFQFTFSIKTYDEMVKKSSTTTSQINLVDLAGSERASKTGASGARLKEGSGINLSLTMLGRVINALAKNSGSHKKIHVPYRNSKLTFLLQNSLGGNSKTVMIAALSPSESEYDDTMSTLRYANSAKQIKNKAVVNEDPQAAIIRSLRKEIEDLKKALAGGGGAMLGSGSTVGVSKEEQERFRKEHEEFELMKAKMAANEEEMRKLNMTWEEKMREAKAREEADSKAFEEQAKKKETIPHILNLHSDMLLAETVFYFFDEGTTRICQPNADPPPGPKDIALRGLMILKHHAEVENKGNETITIIPRPNARVFVNGALIKEACELHHNDRVIFGNSHVFRFVHPTKMTDPEPDADGNIPEYNWEFAQRELHESAMKSLPALASDPRLEAQKKEAEEAAKQLQAELEEQTKALEETKQRAEEERKKILDTMHADQQAKLEEMRAKVASEVDAAKQQQLEEELKKQQEKLEEEKRRREEELKAKWEAQAASQNKEKEELLRKLEKQQKENDKLKKHAEIEEQDKIILQETLMRAIPMKTEAETICEQLLQPLKFNVELKAQKSDDLEAFTEKTEVLIKAQDVEREIEVLMNVDDFQELLYLMKEIHQPLLEDPDAIVEIPDEEHNPFYLRVKGPQVLGDSRLFLQGLYYLFPIDEKLPILDHKGVSHGTIQVRAKVLPPDYSSDDEDAGKGSDDDDEEEWEVENISELKDKLITIRMEIIKAVGLPKNRCANAYAQYKFFLDQQWQTTKKVPGSVFNPEWNYKRDIIIDPVTEDLVDYLKEGLIKIQTFGEMLEEKDRSPTPRGHIRLHSRGSSISSNRSSVSGSINPEELKQLTAQQAIAGDRLGAPGIQVSQAGPPNEKVQLQLKEKEKKIETLEKDYKKAQEEIERLKRAYKDIPQDQQAVAQLKIEAEKKDAEIERLKHELSAAKTGTQKDSKACVIL